MAPQWFIKVLDLEEPLLARSAELKWYPEEMKIRLDQWIRGAQVRLECVAAALLRGAHPGVVLHRSAARCIVPPVESLPVDPLEDPASVVSRLRKACGNTDFRGRNRRPSIPG